MTSLVGLAPWSRDSGHKRDQRSIWGGRAAVRHALYMAALSVIRQECIHQHFGILPLHLSPFVRSRTVRVLLVGRITYRVTPSVLLRTRSLITGGKVG
ncbi:MAG: IS110 family transposase [Caldilineaceae bacterium SB0662_bin_9]|uniref:IS110 family transposase n=1 Tax=Caldilineaceae bacterium SB0662_bin_9 TaxID=2605258 RepID=A0A6B1DUC0_9CHLR|nr:IS110 family transposase [Caldilineaceae bacterium SB0662_bin_9]